MAIPNSPIDGQAEVTGKAVKTGFTLQEILEYDDNLVYLIKGEGEKGTENQDGKNLLAKIGEQVSQQYEEDLQSRNHKEDEIESSMKLALQVKQNKNYPWENASNIKYPLITNAVLEFAAKAYGAVLPEGPWVKGRVEKEEFKQQLQEVADDGASILDRQLKKDMCEWEEDTDKLLHMMPMTGFVMRQCYYDQYQRRNVSEIIYPKNFVINYMAKDCERSPWTKVFDLYDYEIESRIRSGFYCEFNYKGENDDQAQKPLDAQDESENVVNPLHGFGEQHTWYDLDGDGYGEPYIVTIHLKTHIVVRMERRFEEDDVVEEDDEVIQIKAECCVIKYPFLPALDGSFYSLGLGTLLLSTNQAVNSLINQMIDAGHLQIVGGGLIAKGVRMKAGSMRFKPGEYKVVDTPGDKLASNIWNKPAPVIDETLFKLIGVLIEAGKDISSVKDLLTDENTTNMAATTAMALVEQGITGFKSIYKRLFRSLRKEYARLAELNAKFMTTQKLTKKGEDGKPIPVEVNADIFKNFNDIITYYPYTDANSVSQMQKAARIQFYLTFKADPMVNQEELYQRIMKDAEIENIEALLTVPPSGPDPMLEIAAKQVEVQEKDVQVKGVKVQLEAERLESEINLNKASAIEKLASAEKDIGSTELAPLMAAYETLPAMESLNGPATPTSATGDVSGGVGPMAVGPNNPQAA